METVTVRMLHPVPDERGVGPALSLVLPVRNEEAEIGRLLGEIFDQFVPPGGFEVLVADGASTDRTRAIVEALACTHPNLRLIPNPRRLSSAGRNVGAAAARGRFILFLDGHCAIPRRDYLVRTLEIFEATGADCLCRPQHLDSLAAGDWAEAIAAARHSRFGHNPGSDIYADEPGFTEPETAGAAYTARCVRALGGYDERFDACEDVEFNHRVAVAGFKAYRHPDLRIDYRPRSSLSGLFKQMFRYGRGRARLMARHGRLVPWPLVGMTAVLIAMVLALLREPATGAIAWGTFAVAWVLVGVTEAGRVSERSASLARIVAAVAIIHTALLMGFWAGLPESWRFYRRFVPEAEISSGSLSPWSEDEKANVPMT